jgi:hypothetical protein
MNGERRILEDGVQIASIRRRWIQTQKWIRGGQREQQKPEAHHAQHTEHAGSEPGWQPGDAD